MLYPLKSEVNLAARVLRIAGTLASLSSDRWHRSPASRYRDPDAPGIHLGDPPEGHPELRDGDPRRGPRRRLPTLLPDEAGLQALDLARGFEDCGVAAIIYTDILRDGMQTGVNLEETKALAEAISIPVIASGGIATITDVKGLLPLEKYGVTAAITGRALYEGTLDLSTAQTLADAGGEPSC